MADMDGQAEGKERRLNKSRKQLEKKLVNPPILTYLVRKVAPLDNSR